METSIALRSHQFLSKTKFYFYKQKKSEKYLEAHGPEKSSVLRLGDNQNIYAFRCECDTGFDNLKLV